MPTLHIIYASSSGHTEYVIERIVQVLHDAKIPCTVQRAEAANASDVLQAQVLLLASGTWNTGGVEGQLNVHMHALLQERAKEVQLGGKPCVFVALGDDRYHYTARASEHLLRFAREHGGKMLLPPLIIVNEPYDQDERIRGWAAKLCEALAAAPK